MVYIKRCFIVLLMVLPFILFFSSCKNGQKTKDDAIKQKVITQSSDSSQSRIVKLNNKLFSVPSPYQAAIFINEQELPYNSEVLNDLQTTRYNSTFFRSANLGVYGADMAYITLYEQSPDAMNYFSVIKGLAEKLQLMGAFNKSTIERIENNIGNQDSILQILGNTYRSADGYFKDNEQEHLACVVISGGWIESMYLMTHLGKKVNDALIQRVGENKIPLDNLLELLAPYSNRDQEYEKLVGKLLDLANIYERVSIDYSYIKSETDPDKRLTKVQTRTNVTMDEATLHEIKKKIGEIRAFIVKGEAV